MQNILKRSSFVGLLLLMMLFLIYMTVRENIHTVDSGVIYRSAQLSPERLKHFIYQHNIRTIVNLRGANPQSDWYRDELSLSRAMNVVHHDIRLMATELPTSAQLRRLIHLLQTAPKPILVHCQGGADRTGFAMAMWLLLQGRSLVEAKRAFSIRYLVHDPRSIGKQALPLYQQWLQQHGYQTNADHFLQWAMATPLEK